MSVSTDAYICYGVKIDEDAELPWDDIKYDDGINDWWREVGGFVPTSDPCIQESDYKFNEDRPKVRQYWKEQRAWDEAHPLPVELVNCCSNSEPMWILAVPDTVLRALRGDPHRVDTVDFTLMLNVEEADVIALERFLDEYEIEFGSEDMGWWLASFWGSGDECLGDT